MALQELPLPVVHLAQAEKERCSSSPVGFHTSCSVRRRSSPGSRAPPRATTSCRHGTYCPISRPVQQPHTSCPARQWCPFSQQGVPSPAVHHAPATTGHPAWAAAPAAPVNSGPPVCHYCRHLANLPRVSLLRQVSCIPWPGSHRRTGSPAMHGPPMSAVCASSTSCSVRPSPTITDLCHFHPRRNPPANSAPEGNTRFAPGTLLLFEGTLDFSHLEPDGPTPPVRQHEGVTVAVHRSLHGFTYATELIPLPEGPWPLTHGDAAAPALRAIDTTLPGANALLDQGQWTPAPDVRDPPARPAPIRCP